MARTIELKMSVTLRQLTKAEVEDMGEDWLDFKDDVQGAVDAVDPDELAEMLSGHFEDPDTVADLLSGSGIMAGVRSIKINSN